MEINEADRLAALRRYAILDTPPEGCFDRVTALAGRLLKSPVAIIGLVDHDRVWFKSATGVEIRQISRQARCASAMLAEARPLFRPADLSNLSTACPLLGGKFGPHFYCGVPLLDPDGFSLGTLCVIDRQPRKVTADDLTTLTDLAAVVMDEMALRLAAVTVMTEMERASEAREMLLKEVHHRVKNNLQIIASMVSLRARTLRSAPQAWTQFTEVLTRIQTVSKLHEMIYASATATEIDVCECVKAVAELVVDAHAMKDRIEVTCTGGGARVGLDQGVPLALLMAEVLSNATLHAFPHARTGRIDLRVEHDATGEITVAAFDDGVGPGEGAGAGLRLIDLLTRQLGGRYSLEPGCEGGTSFVITFAT